MTNFRPWKIWNGGECPVASDARVQVQIGADTREETNTYPNVGISNGYRWEWFADGEGADIIAYREVIEPKRETVTRFGFINAAGIYASGTCTPNDSARFTYDLIDGEVDWSSLRTEKIE